MTSRITSWRGLCQSQVSHKAVVCCNPATVYQAPLDFHRCMCASGIASDRAFTGSYKRLFKYQRNSSRHCDGLEWNHMSRCRWLRRELTWKESTIGSVKKRVPLLVATMSLGPLNCKPRKLSSSQLHCPLNGSSETMPAGREDPSSVLPYRSRY